MSRKMASHFLVGALLFIAVMGFSLDASAVAEISEGRRLWDNLMLWVNFGILAFLFLRYGKKPLTDFLEGERTKIETTLDAVNGQLGEAKTKLEGEQTKLRDLEGRLQELRERIIELGQREKERTLTMARNSAAQMIEDARKESEYRVAEAKKVLRDEMIDQAVSIVEGKLKTRISLQDNDILLNQFLADLKTQERSFE